MRKASSFAPLIAAFAALAFAPDASASHPPAYTMHAGFTTALRNVEGAREECFDGGAFASSAARGVCKERGGVVVAEGTTSHSPAHVAIKIREYRSRPAATAKELELLARRLMSRAALGHEIRVASGLAGGHPAVEQWSLWDACAHKVAGRVFVALPDKIVEVEAIATVEAKDGSVADGVRQVKGILHGVRIRRVGDVSIDPASAPPPIDQIIESVIAGC